MSKQARHFYEFGPFCLDCDDRLLILKGEPVEVTPQAFELLLALVERSGRVVSRDELTHRLWPNQSVVGENSLPQAVTALRRSLSRVSADEEYIETIPKRGYRLRLEVREIREGCEEEPPPGTVSVPNIEIPRPEIVPAAAAKALSSPRRFALIALILAATVAGFYFSGSPRTHLYTAKKVSASVPLRPRRTIAVIGMRNVSARARDGWLATALPEMLTTELGAGGELRVLEQNEVVRAWRDLSLREDQDLRGEDLARIRALLGADLTVSGDYILVDRKPTDSMMRLDLRIHDASGDLITSASVNGSTADLFELVSRAGASLRDKLRLPATSQEELASIRSSWPENPDAARLYSQGLEALRSFQPLSAQASFEKAIAAEPDFPLSHMRLAEAWSVLGYDEKAKEEAKKAFDLSGSLSQEERLWVEGNYRQMAKEWDLAIAIYSRLRGFFPDELDYALALAAVQLSAEKTSDALNTLDELRRLPLSESDRVRVDMAEAETSDGIDPRRELEAARRARSQGELEHARFLSARATLFESYALGDSGHPREGIETALLSQRLFAEVGDSVGYARAVIYRGNLLRQGGTLAQRKALYEEALAVCRKIGNKRCEAGALNNLAGVEEDTNDFPEAEKTYQECLAVRLAVDDRSGYATALNNLGTVYEVGDGNLTAAAHYYSEARDAYHKIGYKPGEGMARSNLAEVLRLNGKLAEARKTAEESVKIWQETAQSNSFYAGALGILGDVLFQQGDLEGAADYYQKRIAMAESIGQKIDSAGGRVSLATVWIRQDRLADAENALRECREVLEQKKLTSAEAAAEALLLKDLLLEGKLQEAQAEVAAASRLVSDSRSDKMASAVLTLALAQARAATGESTTALKTLRETLIWAQKSGFVEYVLESRLAQGKVEMEAGSSAGRSHLKSLRDEAIALGFITIAEEASQALNANSRASTAR